MSRKKVSTSYQYNIPKQDILQYYQKNYEGCYRHEVYTKDKVFYEILRENNLLKNIPTRDKLCQESRKNPITYYKEHYIDLNKENLKEVDPRFYKFLKEKDCLCVFYISKATLGNDPRSKNRRKAEKDPIAYYKEHYNKLGSRDLLKADPAFYGILLQHDLLYILSSNHEHCNSMEKDPVGYYHKHYSRLTFDELKEVNMKLVDILLQRGEAKLFDDDIRKAKEKMKAMKEDPVAYYQKNYPKITSQQLRKKNRDLYELLLEKEHEEVLERIDYDEKERRRTVKKDPVAYYETHYKGMRSSEVLKKDPYLHYLLNTKKEFKYTSTKRKSKKK